MKVIVFLLVFVAIVARLVWWVSDPSHPERYSRITGEPIVIRIDGCQYIEVGQRNSRGYSITHKGDCDNPIHKR